MEEHVYLLILGTSAGLSSNLGIDIINFVLEVASRTLQCFTAVPDVKLETYRYLQQREPYPFVRHTPVVTSVK